VRLNILRTCSRNWLTLCRKQFGSDCQGCRDLFYAGAFYTPWRGHRVAINESVVKSMQTRCTLCRLVNDTVAACATSGGPREVWIVTNGPAHERIYFHNSERIVEIVLREYGKKHKFRDFLTRNKQLPSTEVRNIIRLDLGLSNGKQGDKETIVPRLFRTLAQNNVDKCWLEPEQRWSTIREWIKVCSNDHVSCRSTSTPKLPSRYLDVGLCDQDTVRLVASTGNRGIYACLSHCWGGKTICTLNAKTEPLFSKAIAQRMLPPVFTDAIAVVEDWESGIFGLIRSVFDKTVRKTGGLSREKWAFITLTALSASRRLVLATLWRVLVSR